MVGGCFDIFESDPNCMQAVRFPSERQSVNRHDIGTTYPCMTCSSMELPLGYGRVVSHDGIDGTKAPDGASSKVVPDVLAFWR